ncbi:MAG: amidophosphoribosyltransferase, partial [Clostridia bacterium]|nr:amidophosphoribosyltransferase [Clostridia bacterium]
VAPGKKKKICSVLWSYYGYPTSPYEGANVETMRYRNGALLAEQDRARGAAQDIDYVGGVPVSGTPHAIGYANESGVHFARAFIKYTPTWSRSFMPGSQTDRNKIAKMKQIPVRDLIEGKSLLFVDDSIVRGTQLKETVEFLYENGAKAVHMRSACPPIMYSCKYLNFSRATSDMELIARRVILELEGEEGFDHLQEYADSATERGQNLRKRIAEQFHFASLEFQSLENVVKAIGIDPCDLCTYCWNGEE